MICECFCGDIKLKRECFFREEGRDGGQVSSIGGCVEGNCGFGNRSGHFEAFYFDLLLVFVCEKMVLFNFVSVGKHTH